MKCHKQIINSKTCYIYFGDKQKDYHHSDIDVGYTHRGEQLFIDYNKKGEIIGIELIGSKQAPKPCQESGFVIKNGKRKEMKVKW